MSSVLRYDKSSRLPCNYGTCKCGDRTHRPSSRGLSLRRLLRRCTHNRLPGQFMVERAASRSSVCTAASRFGLHSYFVSGSCLPQTANRFTSAVWIRKTVRDMRDSRMIAGLATLKHLSDAGLRASLKLITHLHIHTNPWDRVCTLAPNLLAHARCLTSPAVASS